VINRNSELNEALLLEVEEVRERILAFDSEEALILTRPGLDISVIQQHLIRQEYKVKLGRLVYLSNGITDALQMQRELKQQFSDYCVVGLMLFELLTLRC